MPFIRLPIRPLLLVSVSLAASSVAAEQRVFHLLPCESSVDLTVSSLLIDAIVSTADTQSFPLGGSITLDIESTAGALQSVGFDSLEIDYIATHEEPVIFTGTVLPEFADLVDDPSRVGETRFPFDPAVASGNPVTIFYPQLTLGSGANQADNGPDVEISNPQFGFVGTGQLFNNPDNGTPDGFPSNYGPYPQASTFPGAPTGPNTFTGEVRAIGDDFVFEGEYLSIGTGGAGLLKTAQVHSGVFFATTVSLPGDYNDDGSVDAADYTVWRDHLGQPEGTLPNDIDGGVIGTNQYDTFVKYYQSDGLPVQNPPPIPPQGASAVPEPASVLLLSLASILAGGVRRHSLNTHLRLSDTRNRSNEEDLTHGPCRVRRHHWRLEGRRHDWPHRPGGLR